MEQIVKELVNLFKGRITWIRGTLRSNAPKVTRKLTANQGFCSLRNLTKILSKNYNSESLNKLIKHLKNYKQLLDMNIILVIHIDKINKMKTTFVTIEINYIEPHNERYNIDNMYIDFDYVESIK